MKIIEILGAPEKVTSSDEKLKAVIAMVKKVREVYGNTDAEIEAPKVGSTNGTVAINLLTTKEKVATAEREIRNCIAKATAEAECTTGIVFDRSFEKAVATSPILTNLELTSDSAY